MYSLVPCIHVSEVTVIVCKCDNVSVKSEPDNLQLVSWVVIFCCGDGVAHWLCFLMELHS